MWRRRFRVTGLVLLLGCLGIMSTRAESVYHPTDSIQAIKLLSLSAKATDQQEAVTYAMRSLSIGFQTGNPTIIAKSYRQLAACYRNVRAPRLFELDSLAVSYAASSGNNALYFDALQLLAKDLLNANQMKKAATYLPLLDSVAVLNQQAEHICIAYQIRSFFHYKKFQPSQALDWARKSLSHAMESNNRLLQVRTITQVGESFQHLMKKDSAAVYLFRALELAKEVGNEFELANIENSLGFLYQMSGDQERARQYYTTAMTGYTSAGFPIDAAFTRLALSDVYRRLHRYDSAYASIQKALSDFSSLQNHTGQALAFNYMGRYFSARHEADSTHYYFDQAKAVNKGSGQELTDFFIRTYEAVAHYELGEYSLAENLVKKELARAGKLVPGEIINEAVDIVSIPGLTDSGKIELKKLLVSGDTAQLSGLDTSVVNDIINPYTATTSDLDSLVTLRQHEAVSRIEAQYRVREIRDSLLIARRDQQIARQKVSQRNQALLFTGLLLLALAYLLFLQRRHTKTVRLLKEEADHRITNTLNNVSAIIEDVKASSPDKASFEILEQRIAPLMVLYEMLSSSTQDNVDMQSYIEIICEGRKLAYDQDNRIAVEVNAAVQLDGKTAGRVGLMVNELVTNAFKHAFKKREQGKITVTCRFISANRYFLSVIDNGTGLIPQPSAGLGLQQVKELAREINATINQRTDQGTIFEFYFSNA